MFPETYHIKNPVKIFPARISSDLHAVFLLGIFCLLFSCSKDEKMSTEVRKGKLGISLGLEMNIRENRFQLKSTVDVGDFQVSLYNASDELVCFYEKASELPPEIELDAGDYYITASSDNFETAAFDNPCYFGNSGVVTVNSDELTTIDVECKLANCAVTITYSDEIRQKFSNFYTEVSIGEDKLFYAADEERIGYFDLQPINILATLTYDLENGSEYHKELNGRIASPEKGKLYVIELDARITDGYALINLLLDDTMEEQALLIDDNSGGGLKYGELLITEIMYDPVALSDNTGEWFEVYNNSANEINLNNLVIKTAAALHVIDEDIIIGPGDFYVLARAEEAAGGEKYIYGSGINLVNTGGVIGMFTFGTDGTDGIELAGVAYDKDGAFPKATGASLSLDPGNFDADKARLGSSWCTGKEIYITGDLGSPGLLNSSCE